MKDRRSAGTATAVLGLKWGLEELGHTVVRLPAIGDGRTSLPSRVAFNLGLRNRARNARRADQVVVPSRYAAGVAARSG